MMETKITVIDGVDGWTPDMLRRRTGAERYFAERAKSPEFRTAYVAARHALYADPMHD